MSENLTRVIRIVCRANGERCKEEGNYVRDYVPQSFGEDGQYRDDGHLTLCGDVAGAKVFESAGEAFEYYTQANGVRPDGKPNRPLTHFTVEIIPPDGSVASIFAQSGTPAELPPDDGLVGS